MAVACGIDEVGSVPSGGLGVRGGIGDVWKWIVGTFGVLGGLAIIALLVTKFVLKLW